MGTMLAIPVTRTEPPLAEQVRAAVAAGADVVELRVDCLGDVAAVEALLRGPRPVPYILTVRHVDEGGQWDGGDDERVALIERLGLLRPGYVDVELATWRRSANVRQKIGLVCETGGAAGAGARAKNRLILSHHDLRGTPADVGAVIGALRAVPGAIAKAVFTARDATDAWRVLAALRRHAGAGPLIALAMGEAGLAARVLAAKYGGWLTFATLEEAGASAPGQPTVAALRGLYRWGAVGPATRVYGVIGWPVKHSLSPAIHNAAMAAGGINGVYVPLPVGPEYADFAACMGCVADGALDVWGLSVTLPHKEHALRWLRERGGVVTEFAERCGAVNTLTRAADGTWSGDNTDGAGALAALETVAELRGAGLAGRGVTMLGAGGAARAVAAALLERGARVTVRNRTEAKAARLAGEIGCACEAWGQELRRDTSIVVNCTSVGLWPAVDEAPISREALRSEMVIFDTIYNPPVTRLLREAGAVGARTVGGGAMFIGQAAAQYRAWHGVAPAAGVMEAAFVRGLGS